MVINPYIIWKSKLLFLFQSMNHQSINQSSGYIRNHGNKQYHQVHSAYYDFSPQLRDAVSRRHQTTWLFRKRVEATLIKQTAFLNCGSKLWLWVLTSFFFWKVKFLVILIKRPYEIASGRRRGSQASLWAPWQYANEFAVRIKFKRKKWRNTSLLK